VRTGHVAQNCRARRCSAPRTNSSSASAVRQRAAIRQFHLLAARASTFVSSAPGGPARPAFGNWDGFCERSVPPDTTQNYST
jgi:hypothetical protein